MNIKDIINYGKNYLNENNVDDYETIVKIIVEYVFKINKNEFILHYEDEADELAVFDYKRYLKQIADGVPIQYITNKQEFMNLNFYVDENVLIPQPDTETLVEEVISIYKDTKCEILDLCTGSGAIGISLAKYISESYVTISDISQKAIQIAKLNSETNQVHNKMEYYESDMFTNIEKKQYDIIVSNPPYIETSIIEALDKQVKHEPYIALDGGSDGLKFYKIIVKNSPDYLKNGGRLFLEIGYNQKDSVMKLLEESKNYSNIYSKKDLGGNDRIIVATRR
ncbi:MAG: peptide chain release factor N(5)-glutamine methyltransferase [Clostridia bacterium]|nr:peptide chain release factor N(5)-glutamine methyltransferase [Clostridia bacterium]